MEIGIITKKNGRIVMHERANSDATIDEIMEIAENEVYGGYADYSAVTIDGKVYAEYEA